MFDFEYLNLKTEEKREYDFVSSLLSDETERFRYPSEPNAGERVTLRVQTENLSGVTAYLFLKNTNEKLLMYSAKVIGDKRIFETEIICPENEVEYVFIINYNSQRYVVHKFGFTKGEEEYDGGFSFRFTPNFHVPKWAKGALMYQIFVDRFRNGDKGNDPVSGEYIYGEKPILAISDWDTPPDTEDYRHFYGGDLKGVEEKLDYLESLGVEAVYFNPLFMSPSSHKYDTEDYGHIDVHFGVIKEDLPEGKKNERYAYRVTSEQNISESDKLFASLCEKMHARGMRVILDGVFNHCGSLHHWFDSEGIYNKKGALWSPDSPYRRYFTFNESIKNGYEGWWGFETLPKLNYEGSEELKNEILDIARRWAKPPYSIDGWRLDVAADLGHSEVFNHKFWKEFRKAVKEVNPDVLIIAEHYGNPSSWLKGDEWDSVMNYDAFMEPLTFFLTGMEKHCNYFDYGLYQNGSRFFETMFFNMAKMQYPSLLTAMNELSNHDHSRFLTRTNRTSGRLNDLGTKAASINVDKRVLREAVTVQMTWIGAPTIYYGDEAGLVGWTDPDCRRTYPWGKEDTGLIDMHKELAALRKRHEVFKNGSLKALFAEYGVISYARFDDGEYAVVAINNTDEVKQITLNLKGVGAVDGDRLEFAFETTDDGFSLLNRTATVKGETAHLSLMPRSSVILVKE